MKVRRSIALLAALTALAVLGASARAGDPGRWRATGVSRIPLTYFQGMASDPARSLWFDGVFNGLYRTDAALRERAQRDVAIPVGVAASQGYNHIGDISWDRREGGRVLLPLECYNPGGPGDANTCRTGSIGVGDPITLRWRYYVKLAPDEIPKAMWAEVSPDGRLLWTSSGADLLAYRTADVTAAHAAPAAAPITAVRRLAGAVPPTGVTGAAFYGERLLLAGQDDTLFQVWSVDLATGARRLEIERTIAGESEGLDMVNALGGVLHWIVTPFDPAGRPPTYPPPGNVLLHFVPTTARAQLHLAVTPRRLTSGRRTRITVAASARHSPVAGADVRFRGHVKRAAAAGVVRFTVKLRRPGRYRVRATRADLRPGTATVHVAARPAAVCASC
jgi:hypothetical protein